MLELNGINLNIEGGNKVQILKNIDLKLYDKKIYVITGPNGSGKSSLARIIMGISAPTSGAVIFNGQDITQMNITQRALLGIGYAFQNPPRFKGIKVRDILNLAAASDSDKGKICDLLYSVGLCSQEYIDRDMDASLSGGEIKRIEIASILARNLKLAVFDEPEAGIDLWSFHRLAETFREMHEKTDTTIVIISHQERILELADEIILMADGGIERNIPKEEILKKGFVDDLCACRAGCGIRGKEHVKCIR
ncbi:MAG: ABC transporter ATP-binding protein [Oscillospiraceae bacterium]